MLGAITARCIAALPLCSMACLAQSPATSAVSAVYDHRPRLELEPRLNLNGGGFQIVSGSMTGGFGMENLHTVWHVYGTYNAAKKYEYTDLKDNTNPHGNVRSIGGQAFYRTTGGWLVGGYGSYASLHTTNYDKVGWNAGVGAGKDFTGTCPNCVGPPTSMRLILLYGVPVHCYTQTNFHCFIPTIDVEQGITAEYWVPSPSETRRHVFFNVNAFAGIIKISEHGHYTHDGGSSMGLLFRF